MFCLKMSDLFEKRARVHCFFDINNLDLELYTQPGFCSMMIEAC